MDIGQQFTNFFFAIKVFKNMSKILKKYDYLENLDNNNLVIK